MEKKKIRQYILLSIWYGIVLIFTYIFAKGSIGIVFYFLLVTTLTITGRAKMKNFFKKKE